MALSNRETGSVFDEKAMACHTALAGLRTVMKEVGFIVDKKRDNESTLRVYVRERLTYPLLNPRFIRGRVHGLTGGQFLEIRVLSRIHQSLDSRLASFPSSSRVVFSVVGSMESPYFVHGQFYLPLVFQGDADHRTLDIAALGLG